MSRRLLENLNSPYSVAYRFCAEQRVAEDFVQETAHKAREGRRGCGIRGWRFIVQGRYAAKNLRNCLEIRKPFAQHGMSVRKV